MGLITDNPTPWGEGRAAEQVSLIWATNGDDFCICPLPDYKDMKQVAIVMKDKAAAEAMVFRLRKAAADLIGLIKLQEAHNSSRGADHA